MSSAHDLPCNGPYGPSVRRALNPMRAGGILTNFANSRTIGHLSMHIFEHSQWFRYGPGHALGQGENFDNLNLFVRKGRGRNRYRRRSAAERPPKTGHDISVRLRPISNSIPFPFLPCKIALVYIVSRHIARPRPSGATIFLSGWPNTGHFSV